MRELRISVTRRQRAGTAQTHSALLDIAKLFGTLRTLEKPFKIEDMLKAVREELQSK